MRKNIVLNLAGTAEMPVVYNADLVEKITKELHDVLSENYVEEPIVKFLVEEKKRQPARLCRFS